MTFDYGDMLTTIQDRQWALADIDWDAPGQEMITEEQRPKLKEFMADLVWIENVGARGFAAMAPKAPTPELKQIYTYFHAEEQRHANAELALMRRWGMVDDGEMPMPNNNIRLVIEWLDRYGDDLPLPVLGSLIPALECALDGALVKFLLDEVADPLCQDVFRRINGDESRHLAVGFQVLEQLGASPVRRQLIGNAGRMLRPAAILGILVYLPLLTRMVANIVAMGLSEDKLYAAVNRYASVGDRSENIRRSPSYQANKRQMAMAINHTQPFQSIAEKLNWLIDRFPVRLLGDIPSWSKQLTYDPASK